MQQYFDQLKEWISPIITSPYFALLSFVLTIVSIGLAIVFYKRTKKRIQLSYSIDSYVIIQDRAKDFPELSLGFNNMELDSFAIAVLKIVNTGNVSIKKEDIAPASPISVVIDKEFILLKTNVMFLKNKSSNPQIMFIDNCTFQLKFDYLNPNDAIYIQILHTALKQDALTISGSIIGESKPFENISKESFALWFPRMQLGFIRFMVDPKFRWYRFLLNLCIGISSLSYAFLSNSTWWVFLLWLSFGLLSFFTGFKRMMVSDQDSLRGKQKIMEHLTNSITQKATDQLKNILSGIGKK